MPQDNFQWLILFRVSMFFVGFAAYFIERKWREAGFSPYSGELSLKYQKEPGNRTAEKKATLRMKISENVYLQMLPNGRWVGWLTKISLRTPPKVGVQKLDDLFQIATNNQMILKKLRDNPALQSAFVKAHSLGFETIKSNGNGTLIFEGKSSKSGGLGPDVFLPELAKIKECCDESSQSPDRSGNWLNVIRALWYGIAFYGLAAVASYIIDDGPTHLDRYDYLLKGGMTGFLLIAGWVSAVFILLWESSWIPIIFNELLVLFSIFALVSGSHLFGDLNRLLDKSPKVTNVAVVERKYSETRKNVVHHFLELKFEDNPYHIRENLKVSLLVYHGVEPGQLLEISINPGFFNCPFISGFKTRQDAAKLGKDEARKLLLWKEANDELAQIQGAITWVEEKYPSGKLRQREPFIGLIRHGVGKYWHENGELYGEITWVKGEKHGRIKLYYPNGSIEQSLSYRDGKLHGLCAWFDSRGVTSHLAIYDSGTLVSNDLNFLSDLQKELDVRDIK